MFSNTLTPQRREQLRKQIIENKKLNTKYDVKKRLKSLPFREEKQQAHNINRALNNAINNGRLPKPSRLKCYFCINQGSYYYHVERSWRYRFCVIPICSHCYSKSFNTTMNIDYIPDLYIQGRVLTKEKVCNLLKERLDINTDNAINMINTGNVVRPLPPTMYRTSDNEQVWRYKDITSWLEEYLLKN